MTHLRTAPDGAQYLGRPPFLGDAALAELIAESDARRPAAVLGDRQFYVTGGPAAARLALSEDLRELVSAHSVPVRPTRSCDYLYYDRAGFGIDPHVDTDDFATNVILMLRHEGGSSGLVLFPDGPRRPVQVPLAPGDLVVFRADQVVHGRTPLVAGERVHLLTFGFTAVQG